MFKKIFAVWKKEGLLKKALENTEVMFELVSKNFDRANEQLIKDIDVKQAKIYMTDKEINECEKDVRRRILEHLSINPKQDLSYSLILITVVKDLERIGDYVKNIVELAQHYPRKLPESPYSSELIKISDKMSLVLKDSLRVFRETDKQKAEEYYRFHREVTEKTDSMILHIMDDDTLLVREAVVFALFSRYLKRIAAHLGNILTTIINPFHLVGYGIDPGKNEEVE